MSRDFKFENILVDIEDYEIGEIIGKGGFGIVFKAIEKKTQEIVAIKVIHKKDFLESKRGQVSIIRELAIPNILHLPGIVKVKGFRFPLTEEEKLKNKMLEIERTDINGRKVIVDMTGPIFITELMENGSIEKITREYLKNQGTTISHDKMNPTIRSKIIFDIAAKMKRIHKKKVVHRDLKLENIFLDDKNEPKIADFGLSKCILEGTQMTMRIGSPFYMAPELFISTDNNYSFPVDVYAYAFIIYKMFSNTVEFKNGEKITTINQWICQICRNERPIKDKQ